MKLTKGLTEEIAEYLNAVETDMKKFRGSVSASGHDLYVENAGAYFGACKMLNILGKDAENQVFDKRIELKEK
jgi:hypothetical protein